MGEKFFDKVKNLIGLDDEEIESDNVIDENLYGYNNNLPANNNSNSYSNRVVNIHTNKQIKVILLQPDDFNDCPKIVNNLKNKKPVIINLENLESDIAKKIFDFVSGAIFALDGNIQKISNNIFLLAPENVYVVGKAQDNISIGNIKNYKE